MDKTKSLAVVNKEISRELADPAIGRALLATTFKGLSEQSMRQAIFEGMVRGLKFKDFLEKNVFAIPFKDGYSLVTSIDYARKIGMRSGVIGKSAPSFEMDKKAIISCSITIKRRVGKDIGEYTATVYMDEYNSGRNLWSSKPRTMLAKVCEMHALRMACPEEMSQVYTEEELEKEDFDRDGITDDTVPAIHIGEQEREQKPNLMIDRTSAREGMVTKQEVEIPQDEESQINMILGLVAKKWPGTDLRDKKQIRTLIADYTELEYTLVNYPAIIKALK